MTPSPDLTIVETRVYRGANIWSYEKAIHLVVDLAPWWIQALVLAFWALFALCGLIAIRESDLEFESEKEDRQ
jgi:hypothetical protein